MRKLCMQMCMLELKYGNTILRILVEGCEWDCKYETVSVRE